MPHLGVNIDHIATLRQARREFDPDPVKAALICEKSGADSIVCHLREDRRHIHDRDVKALRLALRGRLNLEMSLAKEIVDFAVRVVPDQATLVPEKRKELTTEGGLDVDRLFSKITNAVDRLHRKNIQVSLFIDPVKRQVERAKESGAEIIELHTGCYANARTPLCRKKEYEKIRKMTRYASGLGLIVDAGHGLKYHNTKKIAAIPGIEELNIGHSIIAQAAFDGLAKAVREMKQICRGKTG